MINQPIHNEVWSVQNCGIKVAGLGEFIGPH